MQRIREAFIVAIVASWVGWTAHSLFGRQDETTGVYLGLPVGIDEEGAGDGSK